MSVTQVLILFLLTHHSTNGYKYKRDTSTKQLLNDLEREMLENGGDLSHMDTKSLKCTSCPPGYGVMTPCNGSQDTTCVPCPGGIMSGYHVHLSWMWHVLHAFIISIQNKVVAMVMRTSC